MNIYATNPALEEWDSLRANERARTLAASYFAPSKIAPNGQKDNEYKKKGIAAIIQAAAEDSFYPQWQEFVNKLPQETSRCITATLQSRLLVNLSGGILENAGIALEHICGVPIIPGSAVKGAARRYAIALLQEAEEAQKEELMEKFISIFGCVEQDFEPNSDLALAVDSDTLRILEKSYGKRRGGVFFMQAVPQNGVKLCADVLTPHHKQYMEGKEKDPVDSEDPEPSYFPAVTADKSSVFTFTLYAPQHPALLDTAEEWLTQAITLFGVGAKGAAGYGYFSVRDKSLQGFSPEQQQGLEFVIPKKSVDDMLKKFEKESKKKPWNYWALLYTICLPESDPRSRMKVYLDFLRKDNKSSQEKKAITAMQEMAAAHNLKLPHA